MKRLLKTTPKHDGFRMCADTEPQKQVWLLWPERTDTYRYGAKFAQKAVTVSANLLSEYQKVTVGVSNNQYKNARNRLNDTVRVVEISSNDAWMRDTGPIFVIDKNRTVRGVNFKVNSYGGLNGGLYFPWDKDLLISQKVLEIENCKYYDAPMILEGGSILVDNEGTCYTTEECLLNKNRNPEYSKQQIEEVLINYLGIEKIVWLPNGLFDDETDGHIDDVISIPKAGKILLHWTDDKSRADYKRCRKNLAAIEKQKDARNRSIEVVKVPLPELMISTKDEIDTIDLENTSYERDETTILTGSYLNFFVSNEVIIVPWFNLNSDIKAHQIIAKNYPNYKIIPLKVGRELLLGGGNIHCITQMQPLGKNEC